MSYHAITHCTHVPPTGCLHDIDPQPNATTVSRYSPSFTCAVCVMQSQVVLFGIERTLIIAK